MYLYGYERHSSIATIRGTREQIFLSNLRTTCFDSSHSNSMRGERPSIAWHHWLWEAMHGGR